MTTGSELTDAVESVRARIAAAAQRAGRDPNSVRLIGVTKTVGAAATRRLFRAGVTDLGENRALDGAAKVQAVAAEGDAPVWHFIGHLQRNKAAKVWGHFDWIHSVDSLRLLEQLQQCGEQNPRRPRLLLQVNVASEPQKHGLAPDEVAEVCARAAALPHCDVAGLMCMAPLAEDPEASRPVFRALRELRDDASVRSGVELPELSMGMSQDFEIAVEEGATLVRVGTALTSSLRGAAA